MIAIEIIGYGKNRRFTLKQVFPNGTNPIDGKTYRTESAARDAASRAGLTVETVGGFYEITAEAARKKNLTDPA